MKRWVKVLRVDVLHEIAYYYLNDGQRSQLTKYGDPCMLVLMDTSYNLSYSIVVFNQLHFKSKIAFYNE